MQRITLVENTDDETQFMFKFPLGEFKFIDSNATLVVGVRNSAEIFNETDRFWRNVTLFDSRCRICHNNVVSTTQVNPKACYDNITNVCLKRVSLFFDFGNKLKNLSLKFGYLI
jgi:hypothetical protein